MTNVNNPIRVSISEAARLFGVSTKTIQRAIAQGELVYIVVRGRYKINFASLVAWSQKKVTVKNKFTSHCLFPFFQQLFQSSPESA